MYKTSSAKIWRKLGSRSLYEADNAKLLTWSEVHAAPHGFEKFTPYVIGIVETESGNRLTAQIVDTDVNTLRYGLRLRPVFRKYYEAGDDGIIHYGIKFTTV